MLCSNIMNDPVVLPCQCSVCMEHVETFEKDGGSIRCGCCNDTFTQPNLRINKRFKASIENEEYLTDGEKQIKIESKEVLNDLQLSIEVLNPRESNLTKKNSDHFDKIRKEIDEHNLKLKKQIDLFTTELKNRSQQLEEEFKNKIISTGKQVRSLSSEHEKKRNFLDDLFRRTNVSIQTVNSYKKEIDTISQDSQLVKKSFDQIFNEISNVAFSSNNILTQESFGRLCPKLNENTKVIPFELENVEKAVLPPNDINVNHESISVTSTTNLQQLGINNSVSCIELNANGYNSDDNSEITQSNDENELNCDFSVNFEKCVEESTENFISFSRSNPKYNGGFIIINLNTFEILQKNSFDCKSWCAQVFQGDKIFVGTSGGKIKLVSLNNPKICYKTFSFNSKQRINCLKVIPGKNDAKPRLVSGHQDNLIKIWDISTAKCLHTLIGHHSWINCIEYLPDGNLISGSNDGTMKVWSLIDGSLIRTLTRKPSKISNRSLSIYCMKLLDNQRVICGSGDGFIEIWNFETEKCLSKTCAHLKYIWQLGLTHTGELVSCSGDKTIKAWLIEENEIKFIRDFGQHRYEPFTFLLREDGILICGCFDGFKKFDFYSGNCIETKESAFSSDQIQYISHFK
jgi:hypothetical protein